MFRQPRVMLTLAAALLAAAPAAGQPPARRDNRSHILLPGGPASREALEELLTQRLQGARDLGVLPDLVKDILDDPGKFGISQEELLKAAEQFKKNGGQLPFDL